MTSIPNLVSFSTPPQILATVSDLKDVPIRAALQEFTSRRKPEVDAAVDLSDDPPLPGLARSWGSVGKAVIRMVVLTTAHNIVPSIPGCSFYPGLSPFIPIYLPI